MHTWARELFDLMQSVVPRLEEESVKTARDGVYLTTDEAWAIRSVLAEREIPSGGRDGDLYYGTQRQGVCMGYDLDDEAWYVVFYNIDMS